MNHRRRGELGRSRRHPLPGTPVCSRNAVTLRTSSICRLAAAHIAASNVAAAAGSVSNEVAILDSGATHHLWPFYQAFINYRRVHNQHVTLADNSEVRIAGKGTIAVKMGGKKVVIRDMYHVPDLFSLCSASAFTGGCPNAGTTATTTACVIFPLLPAGCGRRVGHLRPVPLDWTLKC